jgi:hypothetical protein
MPSIRWAASRPPRQAPRWRPSATGIEQVSEPDRGTTPRGGIVRDSGIPPLTAFGPILCDRRRLVVSRAGDLELDPRLLGLTRGRNVGD